MAENEKKGFFSRIKEGLTKTRDNITNKIDQLVHNYKEMDDEFYEDLQDILILADVGVNTSEAIIERLREKVRENRTDDPERVRELLSEVVAEIMEGEMEPLKSPAILLVVGVNGVGKTTTIGKLASRYAAEGKSVLLAAADTFRAAAAQQLTIWAERAGVPIVAHQEGSDPAAVVFDAIASAKARGTDIVIVDTAGRLHNKKNLMDELAKISRVIEREYPEADRRTLLVLDATTGQNGLNQARAFSECTGLNGIVLTKLDSTAKGGIVIAIQHNLHLPVAYVGLGEGIDDLQRFIPSDYAKALL